MVKKQRIQPFLFESDVEWMDKIIKKSKDGHLWKNDKIRSYGDVLTLIIEEFRETNPSLQEKIFGFRLD